MQTRLERLQELNKLYPTDKGETGHNYWPAYALHLPLKCRLMLEVGVAQGYSAQIWDQYFEKEVDLHLLDLYMDTKHVSPRWVRDHGWVPLIGDQSNIGFLSTIPYKYEIIVEDGSHNSHHQLLSFKHLFLNNLISGGIYFMEDVSCCNDPFYWGGDVTCFEETPLYMFREFKKTNTLVNPYFNEGEAEVFKNLIASVEIVSNEQMIIIKRR